MSSSEVAGKVCSCPGRGQLGFRPGRGGLPSAAQQPNFFFLEVLRTTLGRGVLRDFGGEAG